MLIRPLSREFRNLPENVQDEISLVLQDIPVRLSKLAEILGLKIRAANLPKGISGEIRPSKETESGFIIRVNKHESLNRQRFTVAHEIAHYLLHSERIGNGVSDDFLYRSGLSNQIEAEANRLAADMLMPPKAIQFQLENYSGFDPISDVRKLANDFGVSEHAMSIRLGL